MTIFIVRIRPNTELKNVDMEDKKQSLKIHHDYVDSLCEKNIILFGGPIVEQAGGMLVINLPSEEAVNETFNQDPMISKNYVTIEISEWNIKHNMEQFNKLLSK